MTVCWPRYVLCAVLGDCIDVCCALVKTRILGCKDLHTCASVCIDRTMASYWEGGLGIPGTK